MEIRPFRGWRYDTADGDISRFVAPPYDVLSAEDKRRLLAGCDRNIVAVDLPHCPPKEAGPDEEYRQAAQTLRQWMAAGVLKQEDRPALYGYEQTFTWGGRQYARRALMCGVRGTPLGEDVIPHEHVFPGPKADRLKLNEHTRMQLSPIFGFFDDSAGVMDMLYRAAGEPVASGRREEVTGKLWAMTDAKVIAAVTHALRNTKVYIADGHHRYTTALNYRDNLIKAGKADANHESNFVFFHLVAREDPGLLILPTHRMIRGLSKDFSLQNLKNNTPGFQWQQVEGPVDLRDADAFLGRFGRGAMAFLTAREAWVARLTEPERMVEVAAQEGEAWRGLDVAILHKLIIDRAMQPWRTKDLTIEYTPHGQVVTEACRAGEIQLGICLQGTPLAAVEAVANAGGVMPHKSTYFYPKPSTGAVLKPLE